MNWYGNVANRIEEGIEIPEITVGTDITMYYWSDRTCYFVTDVIDQKHIKVRRYHVCADHDKVDGMGHQNWLYFKTYKEMCDYLNDHGIIREYKEENEYKDDLWVYRYKKWKVDCPVDGEHNYYDLPGKISFGIRNYYYDWEF